MKFAIIQHNKNKDEDNVIYTSRGRWPYETILKKMLDGLPKKMLKKYSKAEIQAAFDIAWDKTVAEFQENTVRLK